MTKLKETLEKLLEAAHPAYVSDDHFREKLIVARDNALQELESHRLDMEDHIADAGKMVSLRDQFAMRAYARKAIKADRQKRIEPVAWIVPDFGFLFPSKDAAERYLSNAGDARKPTPVYVAPQSATPKFGEE